MMITLSMIVKDEEKYLRDCLNSVADVVDEIVIVDTGSTDNTIEIAKDYGAKIYYFEWIQDFSAARNFALSKSTGDWILYMDADERLEKSSIDEIIELTSSLEKKAYLCKIICPIQNSNIPEVIKYVRLFKNSTEIRFTGSLHEQITPSLDMNGYKILHSSVEIFHLGYNVSTEEMNKKYERNLIHLNDELSNRFDPYLYFKLCETYAGLGDVTNALKHYTILTQVAEAPSIYKAHAYKYLAYYEMENNNYIRALEYTLTGLSFDKSIPLLNIAASKIYLHNNDYLNAFNYSMIALETNRFDENKLFETYIEDEEIFLVAFTSAALAFNRDMYNYVYKKLQNYPMNIINDRRFVNLTFALFNDLQVEDSLIKSADSIVKQCNLNFILNLLKNYIDVETKLNILKRLEDRYEEEYSLLISFGKNLYEMKRYSEAAEKFDKALMKYMPEPSDLFLVISCNMFAGNFTKISHLIRLAENQYKSHPEIIIKLNELKVKLAAVNYKEDLNA